MPKTLIIFIFIFLLGFGRLSAESDSPENQRFEKILRAGDNSKAAQRGKFFKEHRAFPNNEILRELRINAINDAIQLEKKLSSDAILSEQPEWRCIGPFNVGGRVRTIVHHPTKDGWVYIGAAAGGVWRTTDGGGNWEPLFDFENAIALGALAIDPNNPDILYAGTGEAANNIDAYLGAGIFKSTDGGQSWKVVGLTTVGSFSRIYVHPKNSNLIYAAAMKGGQGLWISTNAGATWAKKYDGSISDLTLHPTNPDELAIGVYGQGISFTYDGGENWFFRNNGLIDGMGRISVQYAPSDPDILYTLMEVSIDNNNIGHIFKSSDGGGTWLQTYNGGISFFGTNNQGFYDNYIAVHPSNPKFVLAGGIDLYYTVNGGSSWDRTIRTVTSGAIHVDQHCAAFNPMKPSEIYIGNDGGVYKTQNSAETWQNINNNLAITQFYAIGVDMSKPGRNYGGTQDNGTLSSYANPDLWQAVMGGDGFEVLVDPKNPNLVYGEWPNGDLWKIDFGSNTMKGIVKGITASDEGLWHSPMALNKKDPSILIHGRSGLYMSFNRGENWYKTVPETESNTKYSAMEISAVNDEVMWAGRNQGDIMMTEDLGDSWKNVSDNKGLSVRYVTDIATSNSDANTAYVTFSGYGAPHVFKTNDRGKSWVNISENLPDIPVNSIAIHPENEQMIFIGTDIGVFASINDGASWFPYGKGLPRSPIAEIEFHTNRLVLEDVVLRIATHGRSMWEINVPSQIAPNPEIVVPSGGEKYISSTKQMIRWWGFDLPVKVEVSYNDGQDWTIISESDNSFEIEWTVANIATINGRVRISSVVNPNQIRISNSFTVKIKEKGSVLRNGKVSYIPYGLAYDGKNGLWTTSFGSNKIIKLNATDLSVEKTLTVSGDTLTDIALDMDKGWIYVHRMYNTQGGGGIIYVIDTNGNQIRSRPSPADTYPIGLEYVDNKLIIGDRDGQRNLYVTNPESGQILQTVKNPCQLRYGPRGLSYDGTRYLYQVCTYFPSSSNSLEDAYIIKIDKNDLKTEVERLRLEDFNGLINGRGISYDVNDKNFWISDYGGNIYKIAGFETIVGIDEKTDADNSIKTELLIYPNPASEQISVSISGAASIFNSFNQVDGNITIELIDILGNRLLSYTFDGIDDLRNINLSLNNFDNGVYNLVLIYQGQTIDSEKILIIK